MKTNLQYDLDSLRRISGSVASDKDVAKKGAADIEAFAESFAKQIKDFAELRQVMTSSDETSLRDAVTALRHLHAVLTSLCQFFSQCQLIDYFDPARVRVEKLLKESEASVATLLKHVYR